MAQKRFKANANTKHTNAKSKPKSKSKSKSHSKAKPESKSQEASHRFRSIKITTPTGAINTRSNAHHYKLGEYVRLTDLRQGYIRYVGQTAFSKHTRYGIELDDKYQGKHNGTYKGVKYFECSAPKKGIFVSIKKIAAPVGPPKTNTLGSKSRNTHGRQLSAMIYRKKPNKSRVSFIVPDLGSLLLSPTASGASNDRNDATATDFPSLLDAYSSQMKDEDIIHEEEEEKYPDSRVVQLILTPTGKTDITSVLKKKIRRNQRNTQKIGVRIPFGALNSKCMSRILAFLTMRELSSYAFVSQSALDSIRLVACYDFRYMLYDVLCIQSIRQILCILSFHKPKELILPMAYFIYDPVVLRLFLQFFNVDKALNDVYKYIHKLVIDDRDIRPNSWLMRPGNYPWNELCNKDNISETIFPFELVECFQSLGSNLWELDIRYTLNVSLSYFFKSRASILYLAVSAENRMDCQQFFNVTVLTIQNKRITWEEIERTELLEWKVSFRHLCELNIVNQRFEASIIDLLASISWLPNLKKYLMSNCHFNEPTQFESIGHMKEKTNLNNKLHTFTVKRHLLSKTIFAIISQFFHRINKLFLVDCKLKKHKTEFGFFQCMTHLTNINIINLKSKKRLHSTYKQWLQNVYDSIIKYVYVCPVIIECNLLRSQCKISSHLQCKYCKQLINKKFMNDHISIICAERFVQCPLCSGKVKRKSLTYHWTNNCKEYYIQCFLCPKLFNVKTRHMFHDHVLRHSMDLDEECGKYEMVFIDNKQATQLANAYPVYTITMCRKCKCRCIGPAVPPRHRYKLIPNECDSCPVYGADNDGGHSNDATSTSKTKGRRISIMKKNKGRKVLPHPYPKNVKLKSIKSIKK